MKQTNKQTSTATVHSNKQQFGVVLAGVPVRNGSLRSAAAEGAADVGGGRRLSAAHAAAVSVQEAVYHGATAVVADRVQLLLQCHQVSRTVSISLCPCL